MDDLPAKKSKFAPGQVKQGGDTELIDGPVGYFYNQKPSQTYGHFNLNNYSLPKNSPGYGFMPKKVNLDPNQDHTQEKFNGYPPQFQNHQPYNPQYYSYLS